MKTFTSQWEIKEIGKDDDNFPKQLKRIKDCPQKLYYRGYWDNDLFEKAVVIVGSRRMTRYGREIVDKLCVKMAANKVTVISGFMYGIDSEAHKKIIEYGGKTVAVLGFGLDYVYPPENEDLYNKILESGGLILSEYENNIKPTTWTFPQRNRIVSGLSNQGVYVIEASLKSGSLITARLALKQGKEVWAVPGMINSISSEGTNWLIAQNKAKILISTDISFDNEVKTDQISLFEQNTDEKMVLDYLARENGTIDEISKELKIDISRITIILNKMNLMGGVEQEGGRYYLTVKR